VTRITLQDGKIVIRDGKVGTEEACCCGDGECTADADCCYCEFFLLTGAPTTGPNPADGFPGCGCVPDAGFIGPGSFWDCFCRVRNPTCGDCNETFPEYAAAFAQGFSTLGFCCNNQCYEIPCCEDRTCFWENFQTNPDAIEVGGWYLNRNACVDERGDGDCECAGDPVEECGPAPPFENPDNPFFQNFEDCRIPCSKENPLP